MIDLIELIHDIITFDTHGSHGMDDIVVFVICCGIWYCLYKFVTYLMGLR